MSQDTNVADVVPAPAEAPVKVAPEPDERPVETEDSFVDEALGEMPEPKPEAPEAEEPAPVVADVVPEPKPEVATVAPEPPKGEEPATTAPKEAQKQEEAPKEPSRLDRRIQQKYVENLALKGIEAPEAEEMIRELASLSVDEKKNALKNLLDENRTIRGQKPEPLSNEDEEAIIEAEVERRYQEEKQKVFEHDFQEDLVATLSAHPELDNRTDKFNPKLEKAVAQIVQSGMLASAAYAIVKEAVETAKEDARKVNEIAAQQSMSGAVVAPPVSEAIVTHPETDEDKFLADALG